MDDAVSAASSEDVGADGRAMVALVERLFPICRSITGQGVRQTLEILSSQVPLDIREIATGTTVLDWTVPKEWNIRDAWIADDRGARVVDFRVSNLHVVNYSVPVRARLPLAQLRKHLHTLPDQPDRIPYRTSYYEETWGFCLTQRQLDALPEGDYEVCIDSSLQPGALTYGELVLPGATADEILISAHVCHPSLCDDNLSGIAVSVFLARFLESLSRRRHTFRFLYAPGTIGTIAWLAQNRDGVRRIRHGLTLTCLGDSHPFTYKKTVSGSTDIDRAAAYVLANSGLPHQVIDFFPYGYDERQYNSPGFRAPVGSLMRGRHGQFPEYHTSGDNLSFVAPARLSESLGVLRGIVELLEGNGRYVNRAPWGEPQLGRRGLYRAVGGTDIPNLQLALLWVLNLSDGSCSLLDVAERSRLPFTTIRAAADVLVEHDLLAPV
jgi:aminopeptidase-like protein